MDGAAMVSISSWVTQTLPDGYEEGAQPKRQSSSSSGVGSTGPVGGASSVKEEEQHHCKPIVLKHHSQITNWPSEHPAGGQRAHAEDDKIKHTHTTQWKTASQSWLKERTQMREHPCITRDEYRTQKHPQSSAAEGQLTQITNSSIQLWTIFTNVV